MDFPIGPEELTAEWLTGILRQSGTLEQASVQSFETDELTGTKGALSRNVLIRLTYDVVEEGAPQTLFTKFAVSDPGWRAGLKNYYEVETEFYKTFSHRVDLPTPKPYYGAFDKETGFFILILEEVSFAKAGDRVTGCTIEEARQAIAEIASFHAAWWEHPVLTDIDWLSYRESRYAGSLIHFRQGVRQFLDITRLQLPDGIAPIVERLQTDALPMFGQWAQTPRTLIHRDYQLDNILFLPDDQSDHFVVVDWQLVSGGRGPMDVSSFLGGNVLIDDRRAHEDSLLRMYHEILVENGVQGYSFDQCWDDYRFTMLDGLFRMVVSIGNEGMREDQFIAHRDVIGPRLYAAVHDLNAGEFLT